MLMEHLQIFRWVVDMLKYKEEYLKDWDYHCGHSHWAYNEITGSIFAEEGEEVNQKVLHDFKKEYDQKMADKLASYKFTNLMLYLTKLTNRGNIITTVC